MKFWHLILVILLVVTVLLIGCKGAPEEAKVFELKFHGAFPSGDPWHENLTRAWLDPLPALTGGRLKFTEYGGGELVSAPELHDALSNRVVDVSNTAWIWYTGTVPEASITWLPMMYDSSMQQAEAYWKVQHPIMDKLYREKYNQVVLSKGYISPINLWTNKKVSKMEDLVGLKVRATGGVTSKYYSELGAGIVTMTAPEAIPALKSGTLDGVTYEASTINTYDLYSVIPYLVQPNAIWCHVGIFWNLDSWNELPADLQKIILEHSEKVHYEQGGDLSVNRTNEAMQLAVSKGVTVTTLTPEELARWKAKAPVVWDWFASQSPTCQELLDKTKAFVGK